MSDDKKDRRVFRMPIIVPLSVIMVMIIHFGYILVSTSGIDQGFLSLISEISFEALVLSEVGILSVIVHNKGKVDLFLKKHPVINSRAAVDELKPILRTNMYSALLTLVLLAIGSLSTIMTIVNDTYLMGIIAAGLCVAAAVAINWYNPSEQKLKQIECPNSELEKELEEIFECWFHKALPNF